MTTFVSREFLAEDLEEWGIADGPSGLDGPVKVDELYDTTRWGITHRVIFSADDSLWEVFYEEPATEMQECDTWGSDVVTAYQVKAEIVADLAYNRIPVKP